MKKYKSFQDILTDMFTEPNNKNISLILVLVAFTFIIANIMEGIEFYYTHVFPLDEYIKEMTLLLGTPMTIYTAEKLGRKYMEQNPPNCSEHEKTSEPS